MQIKFSYLGMALAWLAVASNIFAMEKKIVLDCHDNHTEFPLYQAILASPFLLKNIPFGEGELDRLKNANVNNIKEITNKLTIKDTVRICGLELLSGSDFFAALPTLLRMEHYINLARLTTDEISEKYRWFVEKYYVLESPKLYRDILHFSTKLKLPIALYLYGKIPELYLTNKDLINEKEFISDNKEILKGLKKTVLEKYADDLPLPTEGMVNSATIAKNNGGHTDWVNSVSWDYTGRYLASGSNDHSIKIWDLSNKAQPVLRATIDENNGGHTRWVRSVSWDRTGSYLASGSSDHTIKIWDLSNKARPALRATIDENNGGHTWPINSVSWDHTGRYLASAASDHTIKIWDLADKAQPALRATIDEHNGGHTRLVTSVSWDHTGRNLASASCDYTVKIWDLSDKAQPVLLATIDKNNGGHTRLVNAVSWDHTGRNLASAASDNIKIWDLSDKAQPALRATIDKNNGGHTDWVRSVSWDHTGRYLASGSSGHTIKIWDLTDKAQPALYTTLDKDNGGYWALSVSWDRTGRNLASASSENTVKIWAPGLESYAPEKMILKIITDHDPDIKITEGGWAHKALFTSNNINKSVNIKRGTITSNIKGNKVINSVMKKMGLKKFSTLFPNDN